MTRQTGSRNNRGGMASRGVMARLGRISKINNAPQRSSGQRPRRNTASLNPPSPDTRHDSPLASSATPLASSATPVIPPVPQSKLDVKGKRSGSDDQEDASRKRRRLQHHVGKQMNDSERRRFAHPARLFDSAHERAAAVQKKCSAGSGRPSTPGNSTTAPSIR